MLHFIHHPTLGNPTLPPVEEEEEALTLSMPSHHTSPSLPLSLKMKSLQTPRSTLKIPSTCMSTIIIITIIITIITKTILDLLHSRLLTVYWRTWSCAESIA
jgi:hypothetical protein